MSTKVKAIPALLAATLVMTAMPAQIFAKEVQSDEVKTVAAMNSVTTSDVLSSVQEEVTDLTNPPEDPEAYKIWKENVTQQPARTLTAMRLAANAEPLTGSISNEYIKFNYLNGYYGEFTTGGDPDNERDDNQHLLYRDGHTSFTTIRIDGKDHIFVPTALTRSDKGIIATAQIGDILVKQHLTLAHNPYTDREDVVEYYYTAENTSETSHTVGIRIMLDTMLGENDRAPFRLPGIGNVTTETDLTGDDIPEYWQVFDKLNNPTVIAQGTLKVDQASTPDRVRFTSWPKAHSNIWDYTQARGTTNGDSAVCLYWNERTLNKTQVLSCKTYYGLSALEQDTKGNLTLALAGVSKLEVVKDQDGKEAYSPNPFTITAYIQNTGNKVANNAKVALDLPDDLEIVEGPLTVDLGNLPAGNKQYQVSWLVKARESTSERTSHYSVTLKADDIERKTLTKTVQIPGLKPAVKPAIKIVSHNGEVKEGKAQITVTYTNTGDAEAEDITARFQFDEDNGAQLADSQQERINISALAPGESKTVVYDVVFPVLREEKDYDYTIQAVYYQREVEKTYTETLKDDITVPAVQETSLPYVIFAEHPDNQLNLQGWKCNITGNIYTGNDLASTVSELYVDGNIDAVGNAQFTGWKKEVAGITEEKAAIPMPDLSEVLYNMAGTYETYNEDTAYIKDSNIINQSIKVNGDVDISGTTFEGNCVIIATGDIDYHVMDFAGTGTVYLYSEQGDIYIEGTKIEVNGLIYAPNGKVTVNVNDSSFNGAIYGQDVLLNGSVLKVVKNDQLLKTE